MDEELKNLIEELGTAIGESISESQLIAEKIAAIRSTGYDVVMLLNATIALKTSRVEPRIEPARTNSAADYEFNAQDIRYLKSLHIKVSG